MKTALLVLATTSFLLSGCLDDSDSDDNNAVAQQPTTTNPFEVTTQGTETTTPQGGSDVPSNDPQTAPSVETVPNFPTTETGNQTPVNQDPAAVPSATMQVLLNGSSASTQESFWRCEDVIGDYFDIAFFADQSAVFSFQGQSALLIWTEQGSDILVDSSSGNTPIRFASPSVVSSNEFQTVVTVGTASGPFNCIRYGASGTPVTEPSQDPIVQPVDSGSAGSLLNTVTNARVDFWFCQTSTEEELALIFVDSGEGGLATEDNIEGIEFTWTTVPTGILITLVDGNQVLLSEPRFQGPDFFLVDDIQINGSSSGNMQCVRQYVDR